MGTKEERDRGKDVGRNKEEENGEQRSWKQILSDSFKDS